MGLIDLLIDEEMDQKVDWVMIDWLIDW
jgi:hypothetical protein